MHASSRGNWTCCAKSPCFGFSECSSFSLPVVARRFRATAALGTCTCSFFLHCGGASADRCELRFLGISLVGVGELGIFAEQCSHEMSLDREGRCVLPSTDGRADGDYMYSLVRNLSRGWVGRIRERSTLPLGSVWVQISVSPNPSSAISRSPFGRGVLLRYFPFSPPHPHPPPLPSPSPPLPRFSPPLLSISRLPLGSGGLRLEPIGEVCPALLHIE